MRSRSKILDATLELIGSNGFESVTIAAVAHAAGVTRQTVYSIFGTREDLVSQAITDLHLRTSEDLRERLATVGSASEYIVEIFVAGRSLVRENPIMARLSRPEPGNPVFDEGMVERARPVARELLSPLTKLDPGIEPELEDIVEFLIRLGLSIVLFDDPGLETDDELRRFVAKWVVPALSAARR
nr:TetR/AcrR family transcriptional regulator [Nocardia sp. BMG51109]